MDEIKVLELGSSDDTPKVLEPAKPEKFRLLETAPGIPAIAPVEVKPIDPKMFTNAPQKSTAAGRMGLRTRDPRENEDDFGFWDKFSKRWWYGAESVKIDQAAYNLAAGNVPLNDPRVQKLLKQQRELNAKLDDPRLKTNRGGWLQSSFFGAVGMAEPMIESGLQGANEGLALGLTAAGMAAVAGQAGPQFATPEELVTVPGMAAGGFTVGMAHGTYEFWRKQGTGMMYLEQMQAGVDAKTASMTSHLGGGIYAAIELSQLSKLVPGFKQAVTGGTKGLVKKLAKNYGTQVGQETLQEITAIMTKEGGKHISGLDVDPASKENMMRVWETTVEAMKTMPWLMLPGASVDAARVAYAEQELARISQLNSKIIQRETEKLRLPADSLAKQIGSNPDFVGLQGYEGKVIVGRDKDGKWTYSKRPNIPDDTASIISWEHDNPDQVFGGMFQLGAREVRPQDLVYGKPIKVAVTEAGEVHEREFEGGDDAINYAAQLYHAGETEGADQIIDAAASQANLQPQLEIEVDELGIGAADPVKLGKHRMKATEVEELFGGKVNDLVEDGVDTGWEVELANNQKLRIRFEQDLSQNEQLREEFLDSVIAESGGREAGGIVVPTTVEEFKELPEEQQQAVLNEHTRIGFYKGLELGGIDMPQTYAMYFAGDADMGTLRHEAIHFLRNSGVLSAKEWDTLVNAVGDPNISDELNEERVAVAYETWMATPSRAAEERAGFNAAQKIYAKVYDLFAPIRKMLKMPSAQDAMSAIPKSRIAGEAVGAGDRFAVRKKYSKDFVIPEPAAGVIALPEGDVERHFRDLFNRTDSPTSRQLAANMGAPKKIKGKEKGEDKNVTVTSYADLRKAIQWGIDNDAEGSWYKKFGEFFVDTVGQKNLNEASIIFGITSAQNSAENNLAETLHIMALARKMNPIANPDAFRKALRTTTREGNKKLGLSDNQANTITKVYTTGEYVGGLKVSNYMQTIHDRGLNLFNPYTVQDVHMARVFGWRQREWRPETEKKPAGWKDASKIPGDLQYRYAQYLTAKLAQEFGVTPNEAQAYLWFYAKNNLSPKKSADGSGTLDSAVNYSENEIAEVERMVADGTFDKGSPVNENFEERIVPSNKAANYKNTKFAGGLIKLVTMMSPNAVVSFKPGNARGYGFPAGTTFAELVDYHERVLKAILDKDGQIPLLRFLGLPHTINTITGSWEGKEPSIDINLIGSTLDHANAIAPILGDAFLQDAVITSQPIFGAQHHAVAIEKPDGSEFTQTEIDQVYLLTNPLQDPSGLNFTTSRDGLKIKFLDPVKYAKGEGYGKKELEGFTKKLLGYAQQLGHQATGFAQDGQYRSFQDYGEAREGSWRTLSRGGAGRSDILRRAIDSIYEPVWQTYRAHRQEKGYGHSRVQTGPAEAIKFSVRRSGSAQATLNHIEALGQERPPELTPSYSAGSTEDWLKANIARPSQKLIYFVGKDMAKAKQRIELREAYMAKATMDQANDFNRRLVDSAFDSQRGWKFPKWMRVGKWAKRLKNFQKKVIHMAAHLNATSRNARGDFEFGEFEMRAGLMSEKDFKEGNHQPGDKIMVKNTVTKREDELVIGKWVTTPDGRAGYQLVRPVNAETQTEVYEALKEEYPDLIWALDMYIDPNLRGSRQMSNGVEIPLVNRFSMESMMAEADPTFQAVKGYTPDVLATRSLMGAITGMFNPRAGVKSPGRKYKTGRSREQGDLKDLFTGHSVRAFQLLREKARKEYFDDVMRLAAKPIPKEGGIPEGYVRMDTGISQVLEAVRAMRYFRNKPTLVPIKEGESIEGRHVVNQGGKLFEVKEGAFSETEDRLSEYGAAGDYGKFLWEAHKLKGDSYMIHEEAINALKNQYVADKIHGKLYNMGAWLIRNSTGLLLAMPSTMIINTLTNDFFTLEAAFQHTLAGMGNILSGNKSMGKRDLRFAKELAVGNFLYRFKSIREMVGIKTGFDKATETIIPDQIFAGSTALADLDIQYDRSAYDYISEGEVSSAALQALQYGNIDVRAKQRMTYAWLKANAVRDAEEKGLSGKALKEHVNAYMASPPEADIIMATEAANFEYLNYADSPHVLQRYASNTYSKLITPFPRFGYHYLAKQGQKVMAIRKVFQSIPKEERVKAMADFITVLTFGLGAGGIVLDAAIRSLFDDDDDDEVRKRMGTSSAKYVDPDTGEVVTKQLDRKQITANRINISYYLRGLGLGSSDDDNDFWLRVRNYPMIAMSGNAVLAFEDAKKFGVGEGVRTFFGATTDHLSDFFSLGAGVKAPSKFISQHILQQPPGGRKRQVPFDPYATNVPTWFYITDQLMTALIPGKRQFTEMMMFIDPSVKKKTSSKDLDFHPGAWEAIRGSHVSGVIDRLMVAAGLADPLMPQGTAKTVSLARRAGRPPVETAKAIAEGMEMVGKGDQAARLFRDPKTGTPKLALIPASTKPDNTRQLVALRNLGLNLKPVDRSEYEAGLKPKPTLPRRRR